MAMKKIFNANGKLFLLIALNIVIGLTYTESKQLPLQSLTAREVYRLLRQTGQQNVIPEGRVITHGLAAGAGFALGLKKSLAVVMLYDIITANVTAADLALRKSARTNAASMAGGARQELCFNSRKSRNLNEANAVAEAFEWLDKSEGRFSGHRRKGKSYRQSHDKRHYKAANSRQATTTEIDSPTLATSPTTTTGTLPTTSDADAAADGTGTTSPTTTAAENEAATNCVVLREP